jgi:dTDP-4-amino-4,6-dideoxygalactose transaminase
VADRDNVLTSLHEAGIGAGVHYPKLIQWQEAWSYTASHDATPHAAGLATSILSLPLFPGITDRQINRTVDALARVTAREQDFITTSETSERTEQCRA